ncbi:MAG: T9SS type A sorting domain-containing protein [Bacteroidales bacterium]|nr:T9SS type A sorting domain-containing protein [Bacteroidales bacterium]
MKLKYTFFFLIFLTLNAIGQGDIYYYENFDSTFIPADWSYDYEIGAIDWKFQSGGYNLTGTPGGGEPPFAYQGQNNAVFNYVSLTGETTKLISPNYNMEFGIKPELRFWHAQATKLFGGTDNLKVYYKNDTSNWILLKEYVVEITDWIEHVIQLPDSTLTDNYFIAFEGITNNGFGTCIDSMVIIETGIIGKTIESVNVRQSSIDEVPSTSNNNKILRVDFKVKGNDGIMKLDSISFKSLNTNDDNISTDGVRLYYAEDTLFINSSQLGTGGNFINEKVSFYGLNLILPTGYSSIWLLYDVKDDADHNMQNNILDAYIPENGIKINNYYYPFIDRSPEGERIIVESIFNDDFETDKNWTITSEFERDTPQGKGGTQNIGSVGKADPTYATSGSYVLGTDLTDNGDYENNLFNREYTAVTPTVNAKYYKNTKIFFKRWLNAQITDTVLIDLSIDNGSSWLNIWQNDDDYTEGQWNLQEYEIENYGDRVIELKVQFALGGTNDAFPMSGWNIDDFFITGDYISKDVGITNWIAPVSGCGHTDEEYVEVTIQNYAGDVLTDPLVISYSFDGGATIKYDTIQNPNLAVDASLNYTIDKPTNLTSPGWYKNAYATTNLAGDEDNTNNKFNKSIFIAPTYSLPYFENFESNFGYYFDDGTNSSWEYGEPSATLIDAAASGAKAWVTNLSGNYSNDDSSYIESPCFDFTGIDSVIFEFKCKGVSEDQVDGLAVVYSLDQGQSWDLVPNDHDFYWNWYNETNISELETAGFDETGSEWLTARQLLPPVFSDESSVKFRFLFKSNVSAIYEGFGIDDIRIFEAPYDVGISTLTYPATQCELSDTTHVKVVIENSGVVDVKAGTKIPLVLNFNSELTNDTLTLASDFLVGNSILFTFNSTVDMSYAGDFDFIINTNFESDSYFYNETISNDTVSATITVQGMPNYDIGWIVGSDDVDTLLDATTGYAAYSWYYLGSEISTSQTYRATAAGTYYVTVTNANACQANDSLKVVPSLVDVKMDSILTELEDSCERFELTEIRVAISNKGQDLIDGVNDTIPFGYQINNLPEVYDTLILDRDLTTATDPATDTLNFTFTNKCDLTEIGEYTISVFTNFAFDLNRTDDTITTVINTWGLPDVNLAHDTINSSQADTLTLDAGSGFLTYNWNSGSSVQTETPNNISYYYRVTVTDINSCGSDKDSTYIETHDLGISEVTSPANICEDLASAATNINVEVTNYSDIVYSSPTAVKIFYNYDNGGWIEVNPELNVGASGSVTLNNIGAIDATSVGVHTLKIYTSSDIDANHTNDTLEYSFETWPLPDANLAFDTIYTTKADTVLLIAQDGFASYSWNDGSSNDTLVVSRKYSRKYIVSVTDDHACGNDKDSTQIITYNVGIASLVSPLSACEHTSSENVTISVKNFSNDTLKAGTLIPVGYILEGSAAVNENYVLISDLNPLKSVNYTFTNKVDVATINTYRFNLFTNFGLDVATSNDTLIDVIKTFGYPSIELGSDIFTKQADTVVIVAAPGFQGYFWDDGSKNDSLVIVYPASRKYSITVNDINGCVASDDINVFTYDIAASELNTPFSQCELTSTETVNIDIINNSLDTLLIGELIDVSYILNSGSPVNASFNLTEDLYPDSIVNYTFSQTADLSNNQVHELELYAELASIDVEPNDIITRNVDYQKPTFDLGSDVNIGTTQYTLDAGAVYSSYLWFDDSNERTYLVDINDQNPNNYYAVTVTNSYGCSADDSIQVIFTTTPDLAITAMLTPESGCWNATETYPVSIEITNSGVVNLNPGDNFIVGYKIDGGNDVTETFNLTTAMNTNDTREYTFPTEIPFASAKIYLFKPFVKHSEDGNVNNDTLTTGTIVEITAPEVILGANDTISTPSTSYVIQLSEGYSTYLWSDANNSTTPTLTVTETGLYSVTITDEYECSGEGSIYINFLTDIDNLIQGDGYKLTFFPNPVSEQLMIQFENKKSKDVFIEIVSSNGQVVYNKKISNIENSIEKIDVTPFSNGVYYIRFNINNEFYIRKIIIQ